MELTPMISMEEDALLSNEHILDIDHIDS